MRITRSVAAAAVLLLMLGTTACGTTAAIDSEDGAVPGIIDKAMNQRKLVIGVKADQPGLGMRSGKNWTGFDIEIAKIVARGLGVPDSGITWKITVSADREKFIQQDVVDLVVATYTINEARRKAINFAGPYYIAGQDLLVPATSRISGPESLADKKVCSAAGSTPAKRIESDYRDAVMSEMPSYSECVTALAQGEVDAVTTDDIILAGFAAQEKYTGKFKVVGNPFSLEPYGIGIKKVDEAGCNRVNEILTKAATNGAYAKAWEDTLGKSGKEAPPLDTTRLFNCF